MHTHSDRLERWLGTEQVATISQQMRDWYGPPIAMHGVPGRVYAAKGGDFVGEILAGQEASKLDRARDIVMRHRRARFAQMAKTRKQLGAIGSLSQLIASASGGKSQSMFFSKVGTASTAVAGCVSLWNVGNQPAAAAAASASPGGNATTSATAGALPFANPASANTLHFTTAWATCGTAANSLLLYDRLFHVAKTASSSATESVTGTFSRYQNQTAGADDYIGGNFVFPEVRATIANTAHNWTVCQYTNQAGTTAQSIPSIAGIAAATNVNIIDLLLGNWFMPLASGDVGVKALTQMQCSSATLTGTVQFVVGHPIAFLACPVANMVCVADGINSAFNFARVYDSACLTFIEMPKPTTTAATYSGQIMVVAE